MSSRSAQTDPTATPSPTPSPTPTSTPSAPNDPHAFDAAPYGGGDPYADYRDEEHAFAQQVELTDRRLGAGVLAANDELFAPRENLLVRERPVFQPGTFGHKGQIMDGWETRRRRNTAERPHPDEDTHDWALIRLGAPGTVRGVVVDTAHFRGNYPQQISVEGACVPGSPGEEELLAPEVKWTELVPRSQVRGHAANGFEVDVPGRWTHLRLRQYPDGGIARFRAYGEVLPDPEWLAALDVVDLAAVGNGAVVEDASDRFYSPPTNLLLPDQARAMGDGWENRRRRVRGSNDWVRFRLAGEGTIRAIELDTSYFKGNAAGWAAISGCCAAADGAGAGPQEAGEAGEAGDWFELLPRTRLQPDTVHRFVLADLPAGDRPVTHLRLDVFPDGGLARFRVHGRLTERGRARITARFREAGM
ncbi:allantoicase [Phaeacidiphilus oryzae]|uniref:allantoicase n=1 Tax=Phaeacidiphilus oryzae TaxID=348818 RepID=UPI0009FD4789|nr:allantoicase [Phaeacidiphilus oryzae]